MYFRPVNAKRSLSLVLAVGLLGGPAQGQVINEDYKILLSGGAENDELGFSMDIDNGIVAIGASTEKFSDPTIRSAYLYDQETGELLFELVQSDGELRDKFGYSIAIDGDLVVVGAIDDNDRGDYSGSAYVFDVHTGAQVSKLLASDGAWGDAFGSSVAIEDGVVVVGAKFTDIRGTNSGTAYIFDALTGTQTARLWGWDGGERDEFGVSVAIGDGLVMVGAHEADDGAMDTGAVYVFDASTGNPVMKLDPRSTSSQTRFGESLAMSNGSVVVGAWLQNGFSYSGQAFVFDTKTGIQTDAFVALDGTSSDGYGVSVAIDKNLVAVGSLYGDSAGSGGGAVYVFDTSTSDQVSKLILSDVTEFDRFGQSVAIENGVVMVGANFDDDNGSNSGSVSRFTVPTQAQVSKLLPRDRFNYDEVGQSVAIDNDIVAVGAIRNDDFGNDSGAAYLFNKYTGAQLHKLLPSDGDSNDLFGWSIAIGGGVVAVGARYDADNGNSSGSVYLFDVATGSQTHKLLPSDGDWGDLFGHAVAVDDGVVAVGAFGFGENSLYVYSGAVYLFDATTGQQIRKIMPPDRSGYDQFGFSVSLRDGLLAVGARWDDSNGYRSGSAYVFDAGTGQMLHKLYAEDGLDEDWFGWSIGIDNGLVAVGANDRDDNGSNSGSAYVFDAATGQQVAKLLASDGEAGDTFADSIAIDQGVVAVGVNNDDDLGVQSGSVYLFNASTGQEIGKFLASDGEAGDRLGSSVAMHNGFVVAGAKSDVDLFTSSGSAYVFALPEQPCPADLNGDDFVDAGDITLFITLFLDQDSAADLNADGFIDVGDIGLFVEMFLEGC